jgi:heptosyltransferase-2
MSTRTAVIQAKRGIRDVIWHLPFVRAVALASGGQVTFMAPPTSRAKDLLSAEPSIFEILYFEHAGSELQRGINLIRLARLLRQKRFGSVWILDRTLRPAVAAASDTVNYSNRISQTVF